MRSFLALLLLIVSCNDVYAWGDKGHQVIALIAWNYLSPNAREQIDTLLRGDNSGLTATDFVSESAFVINSAFVVNSTWADDYRDSDRNGDTLHHEPSRQEPSHYELSHYELSHYEQTRRWHYINLKLAHPDFAKACYGSPSLKPQQPASQGPAKACVTDKVEQFIAELNSSRTSIAERRLALKFLIHFVGDLHQPLHVGDNDDAGGNEIDVSTKGFKRGTLHRYWDSAVVAKLGRKPESIARKLIEQTGQDQQRLYQRGTPRDWTMETFLVARDRVYAHLPPPDAAGVYILDENYVDSAKNAAAQQLIKAGIRLAHVLETAFAKRSTSQITH